LLGSVSGPPLLLLLLLLSALLLEKSELSLLLLLGRSELGSFGGTTLEPESELALGSGGLSESVEELTVPDEVLLLSSPPPPSEELGSLPHSFLILICVHCASHGRTSMDATRPDATLKLSSVFENTQLPVFILSQLIVALLFLSAQVGAPPESALSNKNSLCPL
jgi:hypothetical protein